MVSQSKPLASCFSLVGSVILSWSYLTLYTLAYHVVQVKNIKYLKKMLLTGYQNELYSYVNTFIIASFKEQWWRVVKLWENMRIKMTPLYKLSIYNYLITTC